MDNKITATIIKEQPKSFKKVIFSFKKITPKKTLVIGSKVHKIEAVVAPQYFTPNCKNALPKIDVKNEIKIVRIHAKYVRFKLSFPVNFPKIKSPTILNKLIYKVHLKGSICLKELLSRKIKKSP